MARQVGVVKYNGTIGDIRHFKIKGLSCNYAGLKGGASASQIKNDPAFKRTRENMNEFGGCAMVGKSIRSGQAQLLKQMSDPQLTGRLTGIIKKINLEDKTEARGYRAVLVSQVPQYLVGLNFNKNRNFERVFFAPFEMTADENRNVITLKVSDFAPMNYVNAPSGATHFRLINSISVISDFAYNGETGSYEPLDGSLNELGNVVYSDYIALNSTSMSNQNIENSLPGLPTMNENVSVLACVGIEFFQKIGENYYLLNEGNCLKIQSIF